MTGTGETVTQAVNDNMQKLKEKLEQEIKARKDLEKLSKQIEITITPEGLRIELIEGKDGTFFQSGSAHLSDSGQELLALLAGELKTLPNALLIEGHTDATQYSTDANYSNWELSADRANSARRLLQQDGVRSDQVTQVRGYADQLLRVKSNPYDPSNRRISILVKNSDAPVPNLPGSKVVDRPKDAQPPKSAAAPSSPQPNPQSPSHSANPSPIAAQAQAKPQAAPSIAKPSRANPGFMDKLRAMLSGAKK
jgi:chemotaxis protein MotB